MIADARITRLLIFAMPGLLAFFIESAPALDYPSKPVRLIVPLAPGGISDNIARTPGPDAQCGGDCVPARLLPACIRHRPERR